MTPTAPAGGDRSEGAGAGAAAGLARQRSRHVVRGFFWVFSTGGVQGAFEILILMVLARLLGPTAFGIVGGGLLVMRIVDIVSKFGVSQALIQKKELDERHVAAAFLFFAAWGVVLTVAGFATAPLQAELLGIPELREVIPAMMLGLLVSNLAEVSLALLRRELRFRVIATTQAVSHVAAYGLVGVGLAALGFGFWSLVWAYVAQMLFRSLVYVAACPHPWLPRAKPAGWRDLLAFGAGMTGWRLATRCAQEMDNIVVARMLGAEALGLYRRAYQLSVTPAIFLGNSISTVLFPVASRLNGPGHLADAHRRGIAGVALIGLPGGAFLAVMAPEAVAVVLGAQWAATAAPMAVLSLGLVFYLAQQVAASITAAAGAVFATAWRQAVYAAAVLVGALLGLPWGLFGVATGVLAALTVNYALLSHLVLKLTGLGWAPLLRAHVPALRLAAVVAGLAWGTRWGLTQLDLPPLLVLLGCAAATAAGAAVLVRLSPRHLLGAEGLWLLDHVLDILPRRHARKIRALIGIAGIPAAEAG